MYKKNGLNVLAIGAHPDDIEFGCGGTLIKMAKKGFKVCELIMTKGEMGGEPSVRRKEQEKAAKFIGAEKIFWGHFKDTYILSDKEPISVIESIIKKTNCGTVFVNFYEDTHQDHRIVSQSAITASRYIKNVLFFEVPTSQKFDPDIFVDISDTLDDKLNLLTLHTSQVSKTGVEKLSILETAKSCANFRGIQARVKYAEGFKSLRHLVDL